MSTDPGKKEGKNKLDPLYDKKLVCLYCGRKFTSKQVRLSQTKVLKQDSDYCTYYQGENPVFYDVFICPHCGFAFTKSFSKLTPQKKEIVKNEYIRKLSNVPQLCGKRDIHQAVRAMELGALASYIINENKVITGNLFLRTAWLYRYQEDMENERKYLELALRFYLDAYQNGDSRDAVMPEHQLLFLIGDIYARLGRYSEAAKMFSMLLSDKNAPPKIRARATEAWNQYKDQKAK